MLSRLHIHYRCYTPRGLEISKYNCLKKLYFVITDIVTIYVYNIKAVKILKT